MNVITRDQLREASQTLMSMMFTVGKREQEALSIAITGMTALLDNSKEIELPLVMPFSGLDAGKERHEYKKDS